jgi:APA family basic amino acid/polyamine antiporter
MNVASAAGVVAASMIGAGVYTTSGFTLADLGSPHLVLLAWAIGGLIAICGAICYGGLAQQFTESGGEYVFFARAVHPAAGMMAGWVSLLAGFTGAMAFAATTFGGYLHSWHYFPPDTLTAAQIAMLLVLSAAVIHSLGLRRGTRIQNLVVVLKLLLIAMFLVLAYAMIGSWTGGQPLPQAGGIDRPVEASVWSEVIVFANALTWISLSYSGFNAAVYMTDEIAEPKRNVPRAMIGGTIAVTVLYLLLNGVFVYAPPADVVAGRPDVATVAAEAIGRQIEARGITWGAAVGDLVRIAILVGLATSVLALMQTGPRVYQKMATDRLLPGWLGGPRVASPDAADEGERVTADGHSVAAIWLQAVLALIVIQFATLREQLDYLGFTLSICAAICGGLVFLFRDHASKPIRVWGYPWVPLVYVVGTLLIATLTAIRVPVQAGVGLATLAVGVIVYFAARILWGSRWSRD